MKQRLLHLRVKSEAPRIAGATWQCTVIASAAPRPRVTNRRRGHPRPPQRRPPGADPAQQEPIIGRPARSTS